jgi:hypothetical protein
MSEGRSGGWRAECRSLEERGCWLDSRVLLALPLTTHGESVPGGAALSYGQSTGRSRSGDRAAW